MSNQSVNHNKPAFGGRKVEITHLPPLVIIARKVFKGMLWIFAICILIQVFLAGLALFWDAAQWVSHIGFARFLIIVSILIFVNSFIARLPLPLQLRSAALIGFIILIAVSAKLPHEIGYLSALHPVLALMLFFGTVSLAKRTDAFMKTK